MNILVTAGNTIVPIDRVRVITNVFSGRTGTAIALEAQARGHAVTLLTSHPDIAHGQAETGKMSPSALAIQSFRTFDELQTLLKDAVQSNLFDAIIHCAAVSDHRVAGVYAPAGGTRFNRETSAWDSKAGPPGLVSRLAGKVKSDDSELWLRLVPTPKLVDRFRSEWGYRGVLVKFKLEVGLTEDQLRETAETSRLQSDANLMVANVLEGVSDWAILGPIAGRYDRVKRRELPERLLSAVEKIGEGHA
jgi:phosphopantothenoylcysteine synthetase/decarboxylase